MFYKQLFIDRFFHADPHPGNFFVQCGAGGTGRGSSCSISARATELRKNLADGMFDILSGPDARKDDLVVTRDRRDGLRRATRRSRAGRADDAQVLREAAQPQHHRTSKIYPHSPLVADPEMKREELRQLMRSIAYPKAGSTSSARR